MTRSVVGFDAPVLICIVVDYDSKAKKAPESLALATRGCNRVSAPKRFVRLLSLTK